MVLFYSLGGCRAFQWRTTLLQHSWWWPLLQEQSSCSFIRPQCDPGPSSWWLLGPCPFLLHSSWGSWTTQLSLWLFSSWLLVWDQGTPCSSGAYRFSEQMGSPIPFHSMSVVYSQQMKHGQRKGQCWLWLGLAIMICAHCLGERETKLLLSPARELMCFWCSSTGKHLPYLHHPAKHCPAYTHHRAWGSSMYLQDVDPKSCSGAGSFPARSQGLFPLLSLISSLLVRFSKIRSKHQVIWHLCKYLFLIWEQECLNPNFSLSAHLQSKPS